MRLLVLGGTSFVGRAIVERALSAGDAVTLFTRGRTGAELFPGVPRLVGDRDSGELSALHGDRWDAVVDVSAYVPRHVQQTADALDGGAAVGRCLFISTGSVYDTTRAPEVITEAAPRLPAERGTEQVDSETYGRLKVACEDDVLARYGERATVVRPGVVAGPHDPTDRFTWYARRAAAGGRVALPARPEQPVQVVDAGDLAALVVQLLHDDRAGTFNAVGPAEPVTLQGLLEACARAAGTTVEVVPVDPAGAPSFPLVLPDDAWPLFRRSVAAARAVGLTATPLEDTASAVEAWDAERGRPPLQVGTTPDQEQALLAAG